MLCGVGCHLPLHLLQLLRQHRATRVATIVTATAVFVGAVISSPAAIAKMHALVPVIQGVMQNGAVVHLHHLPPRALLAVTTATAIAIPVVTVIRSQDVTVRIAA